MHERPDLEPGELLDPARDSDDVEPTSDPRPDAVGRPDLDSLPVAGITRRRVAFVLATLLSAWIIVVFARQVGEATAASGKAQAAAAQNAVLTGDVAALQRELDRVSERAYILQQARAYGLGSAKETPFTLGPDAPPLSADAPGSADLRLGERVERRTPLESWLSLLFGPTEGS